ncbi:hypothetical protein TBLA_0H03760 [Henningerozyma blattae CBS 6284]|uniref:Alkaline ceramidase n=1 Tax=Henningerozyma blattae (strain ATCC 34711 / CBS 6284 / DSM 70876 / NBRC 10599 / NRRL Y-10934 / UCD 77-7) TaxID=1071380 RepID=I2H8F5_HENB6|nr:hypothetical protein TBLA_0H03760 [Tetrapisispora blattae CBS 6284]CCH62657.1 hypothetical protein TBLA_0H03760 [Tetrapisispora blattae CBS 6284]
MTFLRWNYPDEVLSGYWGPVTSTIDWCEENYVISPFIAEWSNTLTNAMFLLTALYTTWTAYRDRLEKRFIYIGLGFALVGVGSWWFHMTLQYKYQLLDELPMWYATCIPTWSLICEYLDYFPPNQQQNGSSTRSSNSFFSLSPQQTRRRHDIIGWIITAVVAILTVVYMFWDRNPYIQHTGYAVFTGIVVIISAIMMWKKITDRFAKRNLMWCAGLGALIFAVGFVCWIFDKAMCGFWRNLRRNYILLPFGVLFELHGWWHLLTGTGVYYYVVFLQYLRILVVNEKVDDYLFIWRLKLIPELIPKEMANDLWTPYSLEFRGPYVKIKDPNTHSNGHVHGHNHTHESSLLHSSNVHNNYNSTSN